MEKNFKWGPWKKGGIDSSYGPFAIQEYEREGTKDVGEFKDIPAYQSRFDVVDEQSGHHEFDSRSDAMKYAEKSFKEWKKMQKTKKNSIEQKKLAVIKSNAAPEVKLKALEILSNGMLEEYHKMTKAYQTGDKKTALEIAQKLAQSGWKDSARMKDVEHVLKKLSNSYDNAKRLYDEGNYKGIQWRLFQTDYNPSPTKMIYTAQAMVTNDGKTLVSEEEVNPEEAVQDLKKKIDKHLAAQNSYKNADSKLDPAKQALSGMLDQLGYKAMAREVMQASDIQTLKKYSRVVISEFEKSKSPKLDRVKALLGQLGVGL